MLVAQPSHPFSCCTGCSSPPLSDIQKASFLTHQHHCTSSRAIPFLCVSGCNLFFPHTLPFWPLAPLVAPPVAPAFLPLLLLCCCSCPCSPAAAPPAIPRPLEPQVGKRAAPTANDSTYPRPLRPQARLRAAPSTNASTRTGQSDPGRPGGCPKCHW